MRSWSNRNNLTSSQETPATQASPGAPDPLTDTAVRRSAEFLEFAQAAGGFGVFELNLATGNIKGTSLFFELIGFECRDMCLSREEWLASVYPEDLEGVVRTLSDAIAQGGGYETEYRILTTSGEMRWLAGRGQVLPGTGGYDSRIIGTITDITERKELEDQLRHATESLNIAQTAAGVATFDFDFRRNSRICSDNFRELMGLARIDTARGFESHAGQGAPRRLRARAQRALGNHRRQSQLSLRIPGALEGGGERWIGERAKVSHGPSGEIERITGALVDISDLKRTKAALGTVEIRLKRALRGTQDGLWEIDLMTNISWYGQGFADLAGLHRRGSCPPRAKAF